ncbi:MAG TPA: NAD-dependent epimerase/dehydratase family protein, partial [Microlunatus sp.]
MNQPVHSSSPTPTTGRTVLVAGATGMLGSAVAAALHRSGARVTSLSRSPARAEVVRGV